VWRGRPHPGHRCDIVCLTALTHTFLTCWHVQVELSSALQVKAQLQSEVSALKTTAATLQQQLDASTAATEAGKNQINTLKTANATLHVSVKRAVVPQPQCKHTAWCAAVSTCGHPGCWAGHAMQGVHTRRCDMSVCCSRDKPTAE